MREYTQGKEAILKKVVCNQCKKELEIENGIVHEGWISVEKAWGYFSEKDGVVHTFDLCEACYDQLIKGFALPVTIRKQNELL